MLEREYDGVRWGFTFRRTASHLPYEEVLKLTMLATAMYLLEEDEMPVSGTGYEGRLYNKREIDSIESLAGWRFVAELDTERGGDKVEFLVSERTPERKLNYSRN